MFGTALKKLFPKRKTRNPFKPDLKKHYANALRKMLECREDYLILDTETTGLDEDCRIVELCIMDLHGNVRYCGLFNPQMHMPPAATEVNGITDEMLEDRPLFIEEASRFVHMLTGKLVIAWNSRFDAKVMEKQLSSIFTVPLQIGWCDAMAIYCQARNIERGRISLARALEAEGLNRSDAHRAQGDCQDVLNILHRLWEV